jgi:hypothetical protein
MVYKCPWLKSVMEVDIAGLIMGMSFGLLVEAIEITILYWAGQKLDWTLYSDNRRCVRAVDGTDEW